MRIKRFIKNLLKSIVGFYKFRVSKVHKFSALTGHLATKEIIFKLPPLNKKIITAAKLIAPQFILQGDEKSRAFWENEQNATCWGEYEALHKYLSKIPKPKNVLRSDQAWGAR